MREDRAIKVLVVLTQPPLPEGGAPGRAAIGLLRGLAAHGVEVRGLAARQHFAEPGEPPSDLPVEVVPVEPPPGGVRGGLERLRRPRGEMARPEFMARVREAAEAADLVHLEETEAAWCDHGVAKPSLVHVHYLVRRDRHLGVPWRKQFRDVVELALGERAAIRRHRYLVASSPLVAEALRAAAPRAEVVHAPLSLDPAHYPPAPLDGSPTAGLIGTAVWPPTAHAIRQLVETVWPLTRELVPEATLLIAGRGTDSLGLAGSKEGVEVVGAVPSSREFFQRLSVLLYPIERGSGMKVKVLEAIASGVPVVTTPAGAEGIEAGEGVVVEDDWARLASAAAEVLRDPLARRQRGQAARTEFEHRYAPEPATRSLVELYGRMVA
jgi:glycosyltransferase involved in cell wall biosynthesis